MSLWLISETFDGLGTIFCPGGTLASCTLHDEDARPTGSPDGTLTQPARSNPLILGSLPVC